jgi:hypothetical protein
MARYCAYTDVLMPVFTGSASWFEGGMRASATALINAQPSGL